MIINKQIFNKKIGNNDDLQALCEQYKNIKFHISSKSIRKLKTVKQNNIIFKPNGLWFGIGCVWFDFLINDMGHDPCCYIYQVIINDNVKKIKSVEEMYDFGNEIINGNNVRVYIDMKTRKDDPNFDFDSGNEKFLELKKNNNTRSHVDMAFNVNIFWGLVAQKYNGIEIDVTTNEWYKDGRLHNQWFMTWDIPSGTIWKFDNIIVKLIFHKKNDIWYQVNDIIQNVKYEFTKK
uniref:Uncharacterized protein n=1 Tax=viral metagenome TaxID=1070528 RepID=A0A6C0CCZ6_9ZZZZ